MGAFIMLGTLFGMIAVVYTLVLRYDPLTRASSKKMKKNEDTQ
jgi:hypothetical protein